jgi:hypothetical protein
MSKLCFSFPADVSAGIRIRGAAQFGAHACFSYQADAPLRMPFSCYSYPADASRDAGNREVGPSALPGLHQMPYGTCFRY